MGFEVGGVGYDNVGANLCVCPESKLKVKSVMFNVKCQM